MNRGRMLGIIIGLSAALLGGCSGYPEIDPQLRATYVDNVRHGLAARTHFEIVPGDRVPARAQHSLSYLLDPDPDAYKTRGPAFKGLDRVSLFWEGESDQIPFVFDLYLHAAGGGGLAVRIPSLDIRKFLHQSIAPLTPNGDLARLQAHFSEFSRKTKILYRSDRESHDALYDQPGPALDELRAALADAAKTLRA